MISEVNEILNKHGYKMRITRSGGILKFINIQKDIKDIQPPIVSCQLRPGMNVYERLVSGRLSYDYKLEDVMDLVDCIKSNKKELEEIVL